MNQFSPQPKLYTKTAVCLSAAILSPILGTILFANNLRQVGKGKYAALVIIGSIVLIIGVRLISSPFQISGLNQFILSNALGAILLATIVWDKLLGKTAYEAKSPWKPIFIFLGVCLALLLLQVLSQRST